jgi:hypothetical protein
MQLGFLSRKRLFNAVLTVGLFSFLAGNQSANAQTETSESLVVRGEEIPSSYGAPPAFSRTRTSPLTTSYVLPPWAFFFGTIYEGDIFRQCAREQEHILLNLGNLGTQPGQIPVVYVDTVNQNMPTRGAVGSVNQLGERTLTRTRLPDNRNRLAIVIGKLHDNEASSTY